MRPRPSGRERPMRVLTAIPVYNEEAHLEPVLAEGLRDCIGLDVTDAFCGFNAYAGSALARLEITDDGYAMPLQVWVQAVAQGLTVVEVAVPLIYLDESRAFGGALDDAEYRHNAYP